MPSTPTSTLRRRDLRPARPRWRRRATTALRSALKPAWRLIRNIAVRAVADWLSDLLPPVDADLTRSVEAPLHVVVSELIRAPLG